MIINDFMFSKAIIKHIEKINEKEVGGETSVQGRSIHGALGATRPTYKAKLQPRFMAGARCVWGLQTARTRN
jgi:hypothetical protein